MNDKEKRFVDISSLTGNRTPKSKLTNTITWRRIGFKQFKRDKGRYQDSRFLGTWATSIFRLKGFRPQRLSLSQQVPAAAPSYD